MFAEVKYRSGSVWGLPEEAVGTDKQARVSRAALWYLTEKRIPEELAIRFDVVAVTPERITVYENAFDYRE